MIDPGRQTRPWHKAPQAPETTRFKTEHDEMAVGSQYSLCLAKDRVRPLGVIERMRQENGVNRVAGDRQPIQVADGAGA